MKKVLPYLIVIVVVAAAAAVYFLTKNNNNTPNQASSTSSQSASNQGNMANTNDHNNSGSSEKSTSKPVATDKISIANMAFSPADITVKKGTTVTWTNNDVTEHDVTETDGKTGPSSGLLKSGGGTYSFTYDTVGTFAYHCSIHPFMKGTVTVTE